MALYHLRASGVWEESETFNFGLHATSSAATAAVANSWALALTEAWSGAGTPAGALNAAYSAGVVIDQATASLLTQTSGQQTARADVAVNLVGTSAEDSLPPQVAVVVSLRTELANRAGRGRFYLPAPAANAVTAGRFTTAVQQNFVNAMTRMFASLDGAGITPVLFSRTTFANTTITSFNIGDVFDTQRRRRNQLVESRISGTV